MEAQDRVDIAYAGHGGVLVDALDHAAKGFAWANLNETGQGGSD